MRERLQKIIARAGIASRRHAEQLIVSGQVQVNGRVTTELGTKADPEEDAIQVRGKLIRFPETRLYLVLNKPDGYVSTMSDPEGRPSLRNLLRGVRGRVFPVGRLEFHASGLLLLTSDGELANRVLQAARRGRLEQTYWIKTEGPVSEDARRELERVAAGRIRPIKPGANPWYEVTVTDARRDRLRKLLFVSGHRVRKVKRVKLGSLELGALPAGQYRHLTSGELSAFERMLDRALRGEVSPGGRTRARGGASDWPARSRIGSSLHG